MKRDFRSEGLLVLTTLIWGGTFAVIKGGLADISPLLMVGLRFLLAALIAWPMLVPRRNRSAVAGRRIARGAAAPAADSSAATPPDSSAASSAGAALSAPAGIPPRYFTRKTWFWGALIGVAMLTGYAGQTIGLKYTTVARSGFITYSFALYVPFLQFFILGRRPGWGNLFGLLVVVWGLSFITDPSSAPLTLRDWMPTRVVSVASSLLKGSLNIGDIYTLVGAVGYAFYVVLLDRATRLCHPGAVTVIQMLFCGLLAIALSPIFETPFMVVSWRLAGSLAYLVLLGSVVALALMNWFQRRLSPLRAVLIYALEPVFAAFLGWMTFGTLMSIREIIGAILILGGIIASDLLALTLTLRRQLRV